MGSKINKHLWTALDFKISEMARVDLGVGVLFGAVALTLSFVNPEALLRSVAGAVQIVGVVVGAVIAGISFQAAFMDQSFLRKLRVIGSEPVYYLAPFLFTAVIGVLAMVGLIVLSALSPSSPKLLIAIVSTPVAILTMWTIVSLIPGLATLVQFVGLKMDALDVPDDGSAASPRQDDEARAK
ncbi:hypothetical protein [Actinoplanes sp. NBRC 103695]|uniref:hypothetical protein n=1 Tax=Actinoplanes sp. NBRC 103695 TaxID=3032202 RepID=UPI0024A2C37A|nr:hypothetical protein [Actinoplanes sp. NBRC 103695]GLY97652.1 hypothetical protein Acsp02_49060 [Actinoplanes sp. NBRC 103695]